ncbi:hypothetical protein GJAV_G00083850 [Gymnothorax javanicus]|nr:hypothetical protein GJAV_G00083850 [Gymnothorax javanicus]
MADDNKPIHELRFDAAVNVIQSLPLNGSFQPSDDMNLKFYSYFNQATQGPCHIPKPAFWDSVGKVKWEAWNALGDMPKEEAMIAYVDEVKLILESMPVTDEVEKLLKVLGPFYEMVEEKKKISQVSDLSAGFGDMLTVSSKSMTKSIIRSMTLNGTLETSCQRPERESKEITNFEEENEEDEEEDEEEQIEEVVQEKEASALKLKIEGLAGKPDPPLVNGNMEHRASPLTNGSHSSKSALNGEVLHGELEDTMQPLEITELNGHLSDHSEDMSACITWPAIRTVRCTATPWTSLAPRRVPGGSPSKQTPGSTMIFTLRGELSEGGWRGQTIRRGRGRGSRWPAMDSRARGALLGSAGDGERWGPDGGAGGSLNEQIVTALARLQEDMQSVLRRLQTLEALTAAQARSLTLQPNYPSPPVSMAKKKPSWWPFDVSPGTVAFAVVWPFVVQWLIRVYLKRRRRRIT